MKDPSGPFLRIFIEREDLRYLADAAGLGKPACP